MGEVAMNNMTAFMPDKEGQRMDAKIRVSDIQKQLKELQAKPKKDFLDGLRMAGLYIQLAMAQTQAGPGGLS